MWYAFTTCWSLREDTPRPQFISKFVLLVLSSGMLVHESKIRQDSHPAIQSIHSTVGPIVVTSKLTGKRLTGYALTNEANLRLVPPKGFTASTCRPGLPNGGKQHASHVPFPYVRASTYHGNALSVKFCPALFLLFLPYKVQNFFTAIYSTIVTLLGGRQILFVAVASYNGLLHSSQALHQRRSRTSEVNPHVSFP